MGGEFLEIQSEMESILDNHQDIIWSIADTSYSNFRDSYTRVIIIAQRYKEYITSENYDEEKYEQMMIEQREKINEYIQYLKDLFDRYGVDHFVPPLAQTDEKSLIAPFSFKYAAVQAGLGWIGKSGVLVTKQFGPRVRLAAILVNYPLEYGQPITKSLCGDCCACVDACPYGVIKGVNWNIAIQREELLNYQLCNQKRSEYIDKMGRKHTCGYCILTCPWGLKKRY